MTTRLASLAILAGSLWAQTAETIPFRAILLTSNEVPPANTTASGTATVWLHVVKDAQGRVTSASTDFNVSYTMPAEARITGMHIHRGQAGENGPVLIDSGLSAANAVTVDATGRGLLNRQGQTLSTNAAGLDAVNGILANPAGFYLNLHTTDFPGGIIRGQLLRADMIVLMAEMSPANEVPPIPGVTSSGVASVIALLARDASGAPASGQVIFDVNYRGFTEGTTFSGFHIHRGAAGAIGPVTINTGLQGGANAIPAVATGGNLHYEVDVPATNAAAFDTLQGLFSDPGPFYINLHTAANPGGEIRSQLRRTDTLRFPVTMSPANEVPPVAIDATAPALVTVHTLRNPDGSVAAGTVIFDINHRMPGETTFTGLHIHDGKADANGGVTINTGLSAANPAVTATGSGNIYRIVNVNTAAALATLNSLVANPENHYVNLHSTVNPGGVVRAQLQSERTANPVVNAVISAVSLPSLRTVAPGGLMTIFGTDFTKVESDVMSSFNGTTLPSAYNGTVVTIGDKQAALVTVGRDYIVAQVPADMPTGSQAVTVRNANGAAAAGVNVTVAPTAPALFFDGSGGIFSKNADFSLVGAENRARAGDIVVAWATGLGTTTPRLQSGQVTPMHTALHNTATATVTVGGREARVFYSIASPGFAGLYQVAFEIPASAGAGNLPVVLSVGGVASNPVNIALQ